jgi:spermidine synthase
MPRPERPAFQPTVAPSVVAALLLGSGACVLVYQVAWLRLARSVFGASTAASAAVLAIFMGGLGFGGLLLGRRADVHRQPLRLYATLELGVAVSAALTPLLMSLVRAIYLASGGTAGLGAVGGTGVRLVLSALVLGLPAFLAGGTLPAAARSVEDAGDTSRRAAALLYGANTLGAVAGTLWATFVGLEWLGINAVVWSACAVNLAVAATAFRLSGRALVPGSSHAAASQQVLGEEPQTVAAPDAAPALVLVASAVVGFAFLLMELVWYRMLAPLLGGTTYTFGLILAVALLGIGTGGMLYAAGERRRRPTLAGLATTCALEAVCIGAPYALGDRLALFAMFLRPAGAVAFMGAIAAWLVVTVVVVLPAAVVSGYQFPLLVALLGRAERRVGREIGSVYAANTLGAIAGSLAGGFGLLPWLSAPGLWTAVVGLLAGLAVVSAMQGLRTGAAWPSSIAACVLAGCGALLCTAQGPTAFWRHSGIGAGRLVVPLGQPNDARQLLNQKRRDILWEQEGVESVVALDRQDAFAFIVNGKSDGNAIGDAPTQVVSGLIGAILHPNPQRVLVIGLGTGSTAGWLAQVPSVQRVDVIELEPAVIHVAEACAPVNQQVLSNPKVHVTIGDGREWLLSSRETYDVIFSEPSNPYRAGVASLYTREFYTAVAEHLRPDGVFTQWVQGYEVEPRTVAGVYATLRAVLPSVEMWEAAVGQDLVFVARARHQAHDLARVRERVVTEPYRSALRGVWGVSGAEGVYTGFVANDRLAIDAARAPLNTDDRPVLEFEAARTVGRQGLFSLGDLRALAQQRGFDRPEVSGEGLDWTQVEELRSVRAAAEGRNVSINVGTDTAFRQRVAARQAYVAGNFDEARRQWLSQQDGPKGPFDLTMLAELLVDVGDPLSPQAVEQLRPVQPAEATALQGALEYRAGQYAQAAESLAAAFHGYREAPWSYRPLFSRALNLAWRIAYEHPDLGAGLFEALSEPFAVQALDNARLVTRAKIGLRPDLDRLCVDALAPLEPWVPSERVLLQRRVDCYTRHAHPLADRARVDLDAYRANSPASLEDSLTPVPKT